MLRADAVASHAFCSGSAAADSVHEHESICSLAMGARCCVPTLSRRTHSAVSAADSVHEHESLRSLAIGASGCVPTLWPSHAFCSGSAAADSVHEHESICSLAMGAS